MALLSMALQEQGVAAISFTGSQSGIITNDAHSQARIIEVRPFRLQDELEKGKVVIVAGYQGVSYKREVTTLGRGGSDTTAVALAAALDAEACEIYSDVDGVFSADPRVVPDAVKLDTLSYEEMQELASGGARVLNAQAVEFARNKGITLVARSTFEAGTGTTVVKAPQVETETRVKAVASEKELGALMIAAGTSTTELLALLDSRGVRLRLVSLDASGGGFALFTTQDVHGEEALVKALAEKLGGAVRYERGLGSVTLVGTALDADLVILRTALGVAQSLGVAVHAVHTSPLQLTLLVERSQLNPLCQRLHAELIRKNPVVS
jgi:aspartate kinase